MYCDDNCILGIHCCGWNVFSWWDQRDKPNKSAKAAPDVKFLGINELLVLYVNKCMI